MVLKVDLMAALLVADAKIRQNTRNQGDILQLRSTDKETMVSISDRVRNPSSNQSQGKASLLRMNESLSKNWKSRMQTMKESSIQRVVDGGRSSRSKWGTMNVKLAPTTTW